MYLNNIFHSFVNIYYNINKINLSSIIYNYLYFEIFYNNTQRKFACWLRLSWILNIYIPAIFFVLFFFLHQAIEAKRVKKLIETRGITYCSSPSFIPFIFPASIVLFQTCFPDPIAHPLTAIRHFLSHPDGNQTIYLPLKSFNPLLPHLHFLSYI